MEDNHPMYHLGDHHPLQGHNSNNNTSHIHPRFMSHQYNSVNNVINQRKLITVQMWKQTRDHK
jgi:hypothetical protein